MLVSADAERRYVRAIATALGASDDEAAIFADAICDADLRGYTSHGLLRVPDAVHSVRGGRLRVRTSPRVVEERPAAALMDGDLALGPYAAVLATREAMARARRVGMASVALYNCGHILTAGYYVELAAREDLIGLLLTRSSPVMHPHGGVEPLMGTNPLAVGIPAADEPLLLDMATSATTFGALVEALAAGRSVPEGLAIDASGAPTTDPRAALSGAVSPFGGAKGSGLGLAVEILGGLLTGAGAGPLPHPSGRLSYGTVVMAIDPAAFVDLPAFKAAVSAYLARLKSSPVAPGSQEILIPGERSFRTRREQQARGVRITDEIWQQVARLARGLGVDADEYLEG